MQKENIYLDTSVPSAYFDERVPWRMETTKVWWCGELPKYNSFISVTVISEIEQTHNEQRKIQLLELVSAFPCLLLTPEIELIAKGYLDQQIIPYSSANDALHVAIASYYKTDFLLTWNCHHLAEAHRRKHIRLFNTSAGLYVPEIITPMELRLIV